MAISEISMMLSIINPLVNKYSSVPPFDVLANGLYSKERQGLWYGSHLYNELCIRYEPTSLQELFPSTLFLYF